MKAGLKKWKRNKKQTSKHVCAETLWVNQNNLFKKKFHVLHFSFWTYLTLCSVWSLFRFLSSSCFFFSILLSRLVSSETTLASMSLVFSTLSLTMSTKSGGRFSNVLWIKTGPNVIFKNEGCQDKYIPKPPWWQLSGPFQSHWSPEVWQWLLSSFPVGILNGSKLLHQCH